MNIKDALKALIAPKTLPKPNTRAFVVNNPYDISPYYDMKITPNTINQAISEKNDLHRFGTINNLFHNFLEVDDNAGGCVDVRTEALKAANPTIISELDDKRYEWLEAVINMIWTQICDMTIEYKLFGFLFRQIIWEFDGTYYLPKTFQSYKSADLRLENDALGLYIDGNKQELDSLKFIMMLRQKSPMQSILKYYAFTFFCLNNWASMTETFGKPFILGKYSPASTAAEQAKLLELVQSAGTDMAGIISESTAVEFVTYADKQASSDLYNNLIKFAQDRATRRILGQTLTTQEGDTGSYAQAKVHDLVRSDILAGDMRDANALLMQVLNMISAINLGIAGIETKVSPTQAKNPGESIIVDEKLNGIIEIDPDYFYEKYNIPIPQSGPAFVQKAEPTLPFQDSSTFEMVADLSNGRAAKNSGTPASCRHSLPVPVGPCMSLKLPGSTTKALSSFHKSLKELKSYDDVKNIAYPTDLYLAQGNDMWYLVLKNYIAVRKQQGSKAKAFIDNSSPSRGEVIQLDSWMDDGLSPSSPLLSSPLGTRTSLSAPPSALNIDFEFTDTDLEALNAFRAETFIVAGVSSQSVLDLVKSEAEKAFTQGITFTDFQKNLKLQGFEPDNPYFLRTNFNTAVSNANFAARWKNIDADRNLFPYLKYVAVMDNNTRDEHAALDGIVRPIDDPFWSSDYPPNGWNCRCSVEQLTASEANEDPGTDAPIPPNVVPPQFRRNAGKDNTLFGSWLGCDDAKNAMESMPFLESSGLRLHLLYALKQHCPSLYALKAGDLGLQPWENLKANKLPDLIDTSTMSRNELLTLWETTMGDRLVIDATSDPVRLKKDSSKWNKTKKDGSFSYSEADLKNRFKYLNCVEDTLQKPSEIWAEEKTRRYRYLKKYDTGLMLVTELDNNGNATMFNILATDKKYLDSRRSGFLIHTAE